nr:hypothetical protein [Tanacetum cinerariifolium]
MGIHDFFCLPEWTGTEILLWVLLVPRFMLRLKLFKSERPLLLVPPRAMLLSALGLPWLNRLGTKVGALLLSLLKVLTPSMADDVAASPVDVSRPRPSSETVSLFRYVFGDGIHADFFTFSVGPYYATYPEGGVTGNCEFTREEWDAPYRPTFGVLTKEVFKDPTICKTMVGQFPTPGEMVRVESLSDDQLTVRMSVLHCMMMSHGGKHLAHYRGLNQSHHEYVLSAESRLKGYEEKVASLTGLELQVSTLKKQVSGLNDKLFSSDASFAMSKAKGKEKKKKIKSLTNKAEKDEEILRLKATPLEFYPSFEANSRVCAGFECGLSMHQTKDEFAPVLKKMTHFMPANVPTSRDTRVSPPIAKDSTMTPAFESLKLPANVVLASSAVASEQNEEWVNAMVVRPNPEMTDGSERISFEPTNVVVALSVGEKGDGSFPSSGRAAWYAREHLLLQAWGKLTVDMLLSIQKILSYATRLKPNGFPLGPLG